MSNFFSDTVNITLRSGKGGSGAVSFKREKFVPRGGPDGGDGGNGGDVILHASGDERTLRNLRMNHIISAEDGQNGRGVNCHGKQGRDLVLLVPIGSVVKDQYGVIIAQLDKEDERIILLKGGRGGKGNAFFKSSVRQAPRFSQEGEEGVALHINIELKLIADFGFVGAPNAGKSTLLKTLTRANPKIGNYPFTTLIPNLGTLKNFEREIILADIPGLIQGASNGVGLGFNFLKHITKTSGLVFVLDLYVEQAEEMIDMDNCKDIDQSLCEITVEYVCEQYNMLVHELMAYHKDLLNKAQIIVLNKSDVACFAEDEMKLATLIDMINNGIMSIQKKLNLNDQPASHEASQPKSQPASQLICISSYTRKGIEELKDMLFTVNL